MSRLLFEMPFIKVFDLEEDEAFIMDNEEFKVTLEIQDVELNDYVEDFLTEQCDVDLRLQACDDSKTPRVTTHYLKSGCDIENLILCLKKLDVDELHQIFKLNN